MDSYWRSPEVWVCRKHIPPANHHRLVPRCSYSNCTQERPAFISKEPKKTLIPKIIIENDEPEKCAWFKCKRGKNGSHALSRKTSKYCSVQCKNDNARYRFKLRKKLKAA